MSKCSCVIFIFMLLSASVYASDEKKLAPLPIYLFEIRPLVYQEGKENKGAWFESYERLKNLSGVDFNYQFVSVSRLELLLSGTRPGCSLALLKTKPRTDVMKINFIYEHKRKTLLTLYQRSDDPRKFNKKNLQESKFLKIVTNTPPAIDALREMNVQAELLFSMNSIVRMLFLKRIDAIVASNLAIEEMKEFKSGKLSRGPLIKTLIHGIGCSIETPPEYIARLQAATKKWHLE